MIAMSAAADAVGATPRTHCHARVCMLGPLVGNTCRASPTQRYPSVVYPRRHMLRVWRRWQPVSATVASGAACACMQGWRGESEALMARAQVPVRWHEFCVYSSIR